jgi:hypothetical protein
MVIVLVINFVFVVVFFVFILVGFVSKKEIGKNVAVKGSWFEELWIKPAHG